MLVELRVRNFLVIDDLTLEFDDGLVALTGETGAGKSILAGALGLALGARAQTDAVRSGADRARVDAVFDLAAAEAAQAWLHGEGLQDEGGSGPDGGLVILRREVRRSGRSRAWINGTPVTAGQLGALGRLLADIHGQHEHQRLLDRSAQRSLLDAYAGASEQVALVATAHRTWTERVAEQEALRERTRELQGRADFVRFQLGEIDQVDPNPETDSELDSEASRLEHAEELAGQAAALHEFLYEGDEAVADRILEAKGRLDALARLDAGLRPLVEALDGARHTVAEVGRDLGTYAADVEHDPGRLEQVRHRLDSLARLRRKYGDRLEDVVSRRAELGAELAELENADVATKDAEQAAGQAAEALTDAAAQLTRLRDRAARGLSKAVQDVLPELGLPGATFQILLERAARIGPGGAETVEFRATLNPGFEAAALNRAASGGELSRIMLALKAVLVDVDDVGTVVFDEVDAGVGGAVATRVADLLGTVAQRRQAFVITHLAQVASRASSHLHVRKHTEDGTVRTDVVVLDRDERVREVARMLGGDPESARSRAHAEELLVGATPGGHQA